MVLIFSSIAKFNQGCYQAAPHELSENSIVNKRYGEKLSKFSSLQKLSHIL